MYLKLLLLNLLIINTSWAEQGLIKTISSLGYQNGIELNKDLIAKKLLFPLPAEKKIEKITLFLDYEFKNLSSDSQLFLKVENNACSRSIT